MEIANILATPAQAIEFIATGKKTCGDYAMACESAAIMALHCKGHGLERLFKKRYTNEPQVVTDYRIGCTPIITTGYFDKIVNTCQKIQRSSGWSIDWSKTSGTLAQELKNQTDNYPYAGTLENWLFEFCLQQMLADANSVCVVLPQSWDINETTIIQPFTYVFPCEKVLIFNSETLLIETKKSKEWLFITKKGIYEIENEGNSYTTHERRVNDLNEIPAFRLGGLPCKNIEYQVYESFIRGVVPFWNTAIMEFSNFQMSLLMHCFPEKWTLVSICGKCNGSGQMPNTGIRNNKKGAYEPCDACQKAPNSPAASVIEIRQPKGNETPPIIPPAGYLQKETETLKILKDAFKESICNGLAAINMEYLDTVGANQSGTAKAMDRSESNAFLHKIAVRLGSVYKMSCYFMARWINSQKGEIEAKNAVPVMNIPEQFDIYSIEYYTAQYQQLKTAGASDAELGAAEADAIRKRYSAQPDTMQKHLTIAAQNPLRFKTVDDVMAGQMAGLISLQDGCIYYNAELFVNELIAEYSDFLSMGFAKQRELMLRKADEALKINKVAPVPVQ